MNGHDPSMDRLHEILETPQIKTSNNDFKDAHIAQILADIQEGVANNMKNKISKDSWSNEHKKMCVIWRQSITRVQSLVYRSLAWRCLNNTRNIER